MPLRAWRLPYISGRGVDLYRAVCQQDVEGIVAKLASGRYEPAATAWVKIKDRAYSQAEGRHDFFDRRAMRAFRVIQTPRFSDPHRR